MTRGLVSLVGTGNSNVDSAASLGRTFHATAKASGYCKVKEVRKFGLQRVEAYCFG